MPVFLKQYGARRTGTNHLRSLIRMNYAGVIPLMHILGDKHSAPAPFPQLWSEAQLEPDPAFAFVMKASAHAPASSTRLDRLEQRREVQRVAGPLAEAYANDAAGFLISIKDPYAWVPSVARYFGWISWTGRKTVLGSALVPRITEVCAGFNTSYASWLALARERPERCQLIRHEDLLVDSDATLCTLEARFGLRRSTATLVDPPFESYPLDWDQNAERPGGVKFDKSYYLEKRYLTRLSPQVRDAITKTIDWELLACAGYASLSS